MKKFKITIICLFFILYTNSINAEEKKDCSKIKNDTLAGNLKFIMCKRGSNKIDADGNFKEGTFNILKKLKKS
tara:strand:+ start:70 stop:288 length:219 start_codon:yes stop_codon:yes gene_type:complete